MSHLSHSQMTGYTRCPKSFQLSRIQAAPQHPCVWTFAGKALHAVIDQINRAVFHGDDLDLLDLWTRTFHHELAAEMANTTVPVSEWRKAGRVSKEKPNKEDVAWWEVDGLRQAALYLNWLTSSGWELLEFADEPISEIEVTNEIGGIEVKAYLDSVMRSPDGVLTVIDAKSGTRQPKSMAQLALYSILVRKNLGLEIEYGRYYMTRDGSLSDPFDLRRYTEEWFASQFQTLDRAIKSNIFLPNVGDTCYSCSVSTACYAFGGIDAVKYDPDHPQYQVIAT